MAEAAALSIAARLASLLNSEITNYLTDNQNLVTYLNGESQTTIPDWRMKPLTQDFFNSNRGKHYKVIKISRTQNITAHNLARQAHSSIPDLDQASLSCSNRCHSYMLQCPVHQALLSVNWMPYRLNSVRCS